MNEKESGKTSRSVRWWARRAETQVLRIVEIVSAIGVIAGLVVFVNGKLNAPEPPDPVPGRMEVSVKVRVHHENSRGEWEEAVSVVPGDQIDWLVETKNTDWKDRYTGVTTRVVLPPNTTLVDGSVEFINGYGRTTQGDAPLFGGGIVSGTYSAGDNSLIMFTTRFEPNDGACSLHRGFAHISSDQRPSEDYASAGVRVAIPECVSASD